MNGKKKEEDAMSNKFRRLAVLSLLGIFALTGCSNDDDEIYCKPSDYKDAIVTIEGNDEKIHNDILKIIYDAMHDGSVASKTLDKVLYRYAQSIFGSYNKITSSPSDESITLKEAAKNAGQGGDISITNQFIKEHKAYWYYNDDKEHIDVDGNVIKEKDEWTPCEEEVQNVVDRWNDIEERIAENMYSKISSGSYSSKHFFSEAKFVKSLYQDGQEVNFKEATAVVPDEIDNTIPRNKYPAIIIPYTLEGKDVFDQDIIVDDKDNDDESDDVTTKVLHRAFYQTNFGLDDDELDDVGGSKFHYVEKELIPDIYNDLLIEQYLLDEEVAAVRNSRARQINAIKIEKYSTFTINADLLVKELVKEIYASRPSERQDGKHYLDYIDEDNNPFEAIFERYANLSKGLISYLDDDDIELLETINSSSSDAFKLATGAISGKQYYEHTTYGDLVEEYEDLLKADDYESLDTSLFNKYTSNGTTSYAEGFDQEEISLAQSQSITKGWYVQKSSPSLDGSGTINGRLFQLSVSNAKIEAKDADDEKLDADSTEGKINGELAKADRLTYDPNNQSADENGWCIREEASEYENKFLCSINGAFFLKKEGGYSEGDYKNDIVFEDDNAYYIVQVIEAAKDVKLRNAQSKNSYANTRGQSFLNDVIAQITRKVAETGNYASLAKEHWLKEMSIKYHDQNVYDYFKDNYPDLFKDEDDD